MAKKILIIGGTGMLGKPVARHFQAEGIDVRLLVRDAGKAAELFDPLVELVQGDAAGMHGLEAALKGCEGVHISVGGPADHSIAENVASLAPRLGLKRVMYVSGTTVAEENRWFPMTAQKLAAEQAIRQSGVPYTIFCPAWPMEQLPRLAMGGQPLLIGDKPYTSHWFAGEDLARMVYAAYQQDGAANKRFYIHGPEPITMQDALERYCRAFYPQVGSVAMMPIEAARNIAASTGNNMLMFFAELMAYFEKVGEIGDPAEANDLLGAPTTTLDTWIENQKASK